VVAARPVTAGLAVDPALQAFLVTEVLPGVGVEPAAFFAGLGDAVHRFGPRNQELLRTRERLQASIDAWHVERGGLGEQAEYRRFLEEIGYLAPPVESFRITTEGVDEEITSLCGPQLVVPVTNARYALNAANARWGSLYDALYGTDALGDAPAGGPYDRVRGARVIAWVRSFLDDVLPLVSGSHVESAGYAVDGGHLTVTLRDASRTVLRDPDALVGYAGRPASPSSIVLRRHGLRLELRIDRDHPIGASDGAGITDVVVESAVSTIIDFEDSVACVDAEDKVAAYRNWLGLMKGDLVATVDKGGSSFLRRLAEDRSFTAVDGAELRLCGRALLLARIVGHLMTTPAVLDADGRPVPEGVLDTFVVAAIALHDRSRPPALRNSRHGSIYLVKPKLHGPDEVAFTCDVLAAAERTLGLAPDTLKVGIMDEERRTTVNLEACIRAAASRVVFVNTGFLDRTGDEIHTSMRAGPMIRKAEMKATTWLRAYEDQNVDVALRCGFAGRAQIGKGMWAAPDRMGDMLDQKLAHPMAGANCAWVPSPTSATLHATHYLRVDVGSRQRELRGRPGVGLDELLAVPVAEGRAWGPDEVRAEVDNNVQGILGYVVRWVDNGIGCSKVPDIHDVALMEDRATCRISSQHVANWLLHGIVTADEVEASLRRMARVVDAQNASEPTYRPMAPAFDGPAFLAAHDLVFGGTSSPSGYTEPALHARRLERKRAQEGGAT
jgi:malate synthase